MNVIPVVVGALGAVARLEEELSMLDIDKKEVDRVQFSALLGSARILRKVLDMKKKANLRITVLLGGKQRRTIH